MTCVDYGARKSQGTGRSSNADKGLAMPFSIENKRLLALSRWGTKTIVLASMLVAVGYGTGCKSSPDAGSAGQGGGSAGMGSADAGACPANAGGPVTSPSGPDKHCIDSSAKPITQETSEAACHPSDAAIAMAEAAADGGVAEFPPTLYGSEGDDDDCKYHVKFTTSCVTEDRDVTFTVTTTRTTDKAPLTKAPPDLEVLLSDTHVAPGTKQVPKETAPGVYTVAPIRFDAPGRWTVRFHFREECADLMGDSPHGHAAFYVDVP
jgi:hypothetical protein